MKRTQVLSAAAALLLVATAAHAQRGQDIRGGHQDQRGQVSRQDQQRQGGDDRRAAVPQQGARGGDQGRAEQARAEQQSRADQGRADQARAEQARADQARADQARAEQGRAEQARAEQARAAEMQSQQRRTAQLGEQQREFQGRQAQQQQLERAQRAEQEAQLAQRERQRQASGAFDRDRGDHFDRDDRPVYQYRYNVRGVFRETNQFGVDVLRQAVNQGYQEGYRAGLVDRRDGVPSDFQRAFDFESGSFGYAGDYVPQSDYSYYLREGFQRGYDDAYWNRARYGTFLNGNASILSDIVTGILGLTMIH
jgi:hypothetical protein